MLRLFGLWEKDMLKNRDEIKIFILYILNCIGYPLDYDVLHDMCVQDGFITTFDYIEAFDELVATENLKCEPREDNADVEVVTITEKGMHVAVTLHGTLLASVREKALKSALRLLSFKKKGTKISWDANEITRGRYEFSCSIKDNSGDIMDLRLTLENPKQLDRSIHNFDARPEFIYKGILALLTGEANYLLDD